MWNWRQSTGELVDAAGAVKATGYSGYGAGVNNPELQNTPDVGPIPQGLWSIGPPVDTPSHGPYVMALTPHAGTETFGRSGFLIHGDRIDEVGERVASLGCIVLPPDARRAIWSSGDHLLNVIVAGEPVGAA